jgi:multidrug efflux pump subunit AcrB
MSVFQHRQDLLGLFAQHKVAANLLMIMMILAGIWGLSKLNTQFMPDFNLDFISVRVVWSGAGAEDVESAITNPLEQELRNLNNLKNLSSTSAQGIASLTLEFYEGTDMSVALDEVKEKVALVRNLPLTAETPEVSKITRYEQIARILLTGPEDTRELRYLARRMEDELLARGLAKVDINGLPVEEIAIQFPAANLEQLGLSLPQISDKIAAISRDIPAGSVGSRDTERELRSLEQRRDELAFLDLPLLADKNGQLLRIGDVAQIERRPKNGETTVSFQGQPALEMILYRASKEDALKSARVIHAWLAETRPALPADISLTIYDETWTLIQDRIMLLVKNGLSGLVLVVLILYLFLNGRVALWVAVGIPVSLLATQAALYASGGSLNMMSLFAMIMALGIIVDDAIVVGEDAYAHYQFGEHSLDAAEGGARRMFAPVMASSLTTIATFMPLFLVGGIIGAIMSAIPLVIICVILASLIESFFILPGHLRHSFHHMHHRGIQESPLRQRLNNGFAHFRDHIFRPFLILSLDYRGVTLALTVALLLGGVGLLASGRINFTFFPSPESTIVTANVNFSAGSSRAHIEAFLGDLDQALWDTDRALGGGIVRTAVTYTGMSSAAGGSVIQRGEQFGSILVELTEPDHREVRNPDFLHAWQTRIPAPPGVESLTFAERVGGPPGRDIDIRLSGPDSAALKAASLELQELLKSYDGVSGIEEDMPYGREQLIFKLTPLAQAYGLTVENVGRQLRAAFDGQLVQIFSDGKDEVEVRVMLADAERERLASLEHFTVQLPGGGSLRLHNAVEFSTKRGFEALRHYQGRLTAQISADVDRSRNNSNKILAALEQSALPQLAQRYGLSYSYEGRAADQAETMADMKRGLLFALALIYLILAWVFSSYGWPLVVMCAIPFGLIGALSGHYLLGIDMTVLSLFGFFGLSGIVVNDSIVLVTFYKRLREEEGMLPRAALIEAACQRLRAVLLTSLTTIGGLLPILFETSLQAQFLIPMAVSIAFGLMFSTVLVLLVVPSLLSVYEDIYFAWKAPDPSLSKSSADLKS